MDGEIVLDRGSDSVMKLDEKEQAMMDEIQLDFGRPRAQTTSAPSIQRECIVRMHRLPICSKRTWMLLRILLSRRLLHPRKSTNLSITVNTIMTMRTTQLLRRSITALNSRKSNHRPDTKRSMKRNLIF